MEARCVPPRIDANSRVGIAGCGSGAAAKRRIGVATLVVTALAAIVVVAARVTGAAASLGVSVAGNHLVDASGNTIQLHGVDRSGAEYLCYQTPETPAAQSGLGSNSDVQIIASWKANAVRVPLNEDFWLGINRSCDPVPCQSVIKTYVADLNANGLYAVLDLHGTRRVPSPPMDS
jgi:hypothetical protein